MTDRDGGRAGFAAGFDYARRLRDPEFRQHLRSCGHTNDQPVIIALDTERIVAVLARIMENDPGSSCMIAMPADTEPFGFRILFADIGPARRHLRPHKRIPFIEIAPESTMGMLYAALEPCGEFVPSEWARPVVFQRSLAPVRR